MSNNIVTIEGGRIEIISDGHTIDIENGDITGLKSDSVIATKEWSKKNQTNLKVI